ncbi:MAG: hypothetical protein C3F13_19050 [Anaerolineales bacterium]|nr:hypothetical protein [Anaerolineae bacterium]PWB49498.1 MAG: hypothetical protein C3F13_19050 [Anaerolineales bacterium]
MHYLPILTTIITFIFAAAVFSRFRTRHGAHLLFWGIGLVLYGLGALTEVILLFTFNAAALKLWYLCGAMLTAAWLGQGTVNLLVRRRGVATMLNYVLIIISLLAIVLVFMAPITSAAATYNPSVPLSSQYKDILTRSGLVTLLTILLNIYGTFTLVGGAIYSAFIFWRKRILFNRMVGNILIAAGAILPAMGGTFIQLGLPDFLYLSEFLGAILMYVGFLQATAVVPVKTTAPAATD